MTIHYGTFDDKMLILDYINVHENRETLLPYFNKFAMIKDVQIKFHNSIMNENDQFT